MHNQNSSTDLKPQKWRSGLVLCLRWLLGGLAGIGISSWFYFGLKNQTSVDPFLWVLDMLPILSVPFFGHIYLFYNDSLSYTHINDFFTTFPVLFWGVIGALLASGEKNQIKAGMILLILFVVVGCFSFFLGVLGVPT